MRLIPLALFGLFIVFPPIAHAQGFISSILTTVAGTEFNNAAKQDRAARRCEKAQNKVKKIEASRVKSLKKFDDQEAELSEMASFVPETCTASEKECKRSVKRADRAKRRIEKLHARREKSVKKYQDKLAAAGDAANKKCEGLSTSAAT